MTAGSRTNIVIIDLLNDNIVDVIQILMMIVGKDQEIIVEIIRDIKTNRMLIMNGAQKTHPAQRNRLVKKKNQILKLLASWQKTQIHLME
jgi:hypothetical protein